MSKINTDQSKPFWQQKTLSQMTQREWESLCDGCGKCCLSKLQDEDTDEIYWTTVACQLLDTDQCRCTDYQNRHDRVPDCVKLTPDNITQLPWLPSTCAYLRIAQNLPLCDWHPLVSKKSDSVHTAGISVRDKVTANELDLLHDSDYLGHIVEEEP